MKRGFVITIIIGLLIIILLLIFLALFGERPTTNPINYDDCTKIQSDQLQTCCNKWASENNIILQLCMGEWTIKNNQCAWECSEELIGGCAGITPEQVPICCEIYAQENNIIKPTCAGQWELQRGECYWKCPNVLVISDEESCDKVSEEKIASCCQKWADETNAILPDCIGEWTIEDNQCAWECETIDENTELLQECSRDQENPIECPAGYFCYYDNKCHKSCGIGDGNNCPEETPYCLQKSFCIKDACTVFYGCFAEE